jgi:hypothetical protein
MGSPSQTARPPRDRESEILLSSFNYYRDGFASDPRRRPSISARASPRDEKLDARELAAYAAVASMILNLDAAVTKNEPDDAALFLRQSGRGLGAALSRACCKPRETPG